MAKLTADYLAKAMAEGSFRAWLACESGQAVAGGAVSLRADRVAGVTGGFEPGLENAEPGEG